ncbi:uncharacterized protein LOC113227318 isoform X1 [Hyposmocoma kahamanoa]|uniref:uncharacterized protein LOC113227318 isoform X1 n=1 Tax=Hyposmocoma kahamanoa TaxID=1477025 RepID=UPI000E6D5C33|nr:uncharacterized protein LOC113227318 isoform X1 [Hyposmocoma kahamanoa]
MEASTSGINASTSEMETPTNGIGKSISEMDIPSRGIDASTNEIGALISGTEASASSIHEEYDIIIKEEPEVSEEIEEPAPVESAPLELYVGRRVVAITYFLAQLKKISSHSPSCGFGRFFCILYSAIISEFLLCVVRLMAFPFRLNLYCGLRATSPLEYASMHKNSAEDA